MAGANAAARALRSVPLFSGVGRPELNSVASVARTRDAPAGDVLCREGERGTEFFVIRSGRVRVDQNKRKLRELGPGDYFGELSLLDRGPRSATVTALTPVELLVISELDFSSLVDEVPSLAHHLLATLAARLREAESRSVH
jgi:CRP-like cAMP-binding protein